MGRSRCELIARAASLAMLAAILSACTALPTMRPAAGDRAPAGPAPSPDGVVPPPSAASGLLAQSRTARAAGDYVAAAAALERALRIEPNNAALWLEYGTLRMAEGNCAQAATLARKAASLAGDDRATRDAAARLIAEAECAQDVG